jgi:hypothetical protein
MRAQLAVLEVANIARSAAILFVVALRDQRAAMLSSAAQAVIISITSRLVLRTT